MLARVVSPLGVCYNFPNVLVDYRVRQREYLLAISRALTSELELPDVLRIIVQASVEFISGRAGAIVLADPSDNSFRVAAIYGLPRPLFEEWAPFLQGIPFEPGRQQEAVPEVTRRMRRVAQEADIGVTQVLRLPMLSGNALVGMIYVFQEANYRISSDAANLLQSFADQAAIAVKNAWLYQEVIDEKNRLDAILDQSGDGIMILDKNLTITRFNPALSLLVGLTIEEAIGQDHEEVIKWHQLRIGQSVESAIANGWPLPGSAALYVEGDLARRTGDLISIGITYAPLLDPRGSLVNIIANARDLTRYREEEELQKTFISVVSHELKTPVSIIKGFAGTLGRMDAAWTADDLLEHASIIEDEADRLTELIDNLLEASRLQTGSFKLDLSEEIDIAKLITQTVRKFEGQSKIHLLTVDLPDEFPPIIGDERRLTQVLNNLISNALKYSAAGGEIIISGAVLSDYITISVEDPGIGIPKHQRHRIFEKFSRLDNALSRKTEGTGLGLFLSKAIVEAHGGKIWFESKQSGNAARSGTTFTFSLPLNREV